MTSQRAAYAAITTAGLALVAWQLTSSHYVSLYDTGVYLDGAAQLVTGHLPYRSFWYAQPPGNLVLFAPLGLLSHIATPWATLQIARAAGGLSLVAAGLETAHLLRHHGAGAQLIAGLGTILTPAATLELGALKIEAPTLFLVALAADLTLTRTPTQRQQLAAGAALGAAATIKLWAAFPALALLITLYIYREPPRRVITSAAVAGATICAPFIAAAPHNFIAGVILDQMNRRALPSETLSILRRLSYLSGFTEGGLLPAALQLTALAAVGTVAVIHLRRHTSTRVETYLLIATILTATALLKSAESYDYYYVFSASILWSTVAAVTRHVWTRNHARIAGAIAISTAGALTITYGVGYADQRGYPTSWAANVAAATPAHSCTIYVEIGTAYAANHTEPAKCPQPPDPYGEWMTAGYHLHTPPAHFVTMWINRLNHADYFVEPTPANFNLPWTSARFRAYVAREWTPTSTTPGAIAYTRRTATRSVTASASLAVTVKGATRREPARPQRQKRD